MSAEGFQDHFDGHPAKLEANPWKLSIELPIADSVATGIKKFA